VVATLGYWRQLNNGTVNSISSAEFGIWAFDDV